MVEREYPVLSRRQIEGLIAEGRLVFILDQHVIKADAWAPYHPGGDKAIRHMIGRDATDEVSVLHSPETKEKMKRYRIGRIDGRWINFLPPIQGGKFRLLCTETAEDDDGDEGTVVTEAESSRSYDERIDSSSESSSRDQSPIFDELDAESRKLRRRRGADGNVSAASVSSVSSVEDDHGMAYLDSETRKKMSLDIEKYPSLDFDTQHDIVRKYRALNEKIKDEGLYQCNYSAYGIECIRYVMLFTLSMLFLRWGWYAPSGAFMGFFWHQLVFTAHDAGHMGITHHFHIDTVIGILIADFMGGLSIGWWKRNHNVHHIVTNSPEHDPDIEHMPFIAVSHRLLGNLRSTYYDRVMEYDAVAKVMLKVQKYTYYILLSFGRFNLYRLSWEYLLTGQAPQKGPAWWHRWLELTGQLFFWSWYGYGLVYRSIPTVWGRIVFVMVSHMIVMPLHAQIALSHFAMSTTDMGIHESFPQKMIRTTMDIDCPQWLDFFHGGLQFQVIHHLYPRIPRHNLRRTQKLVQHFCDDVGIPYALYGFVDGNQAVLGRLGEVSRQAAILAKCQQVLASTEDPLHHH